MGPVLEETETLISFGNIPEIHNGSFRFWYTQGFFIKRIKQNWWLKSDNPSKVWHPSTHARSHVTSPHLTHQVYMIVRAKHTLIRCIKLPERPGGWYNTKISSYQYKKDYCENKTILPHSYFHGRIYSTDKKASLYWISPWCWLLMTRHGLLAVFCKCITLKVFWINQYG